MNRKIKIKVFVKHYKAIFDVCEIDFINELITIKKDNRLKQIPFRHCKEMQFTGLKNNIMSDLEIEKTMNDAFSEMAKFEKEQERQNKKELEYVKSNIDYDFNFIQEILDDVKWQHDSYVEIEKIDYDFFIIKGDYNGMKFRKQPQFDDDNKEIFHELVWQKVGYCEDDYSGFILIPLKNQKYWKISYSC